MATLTIPTTPGMKAVQFGLKANTQTFSSPLNSAVQTLELPGALWFGTFSIPPMTVDNLAAWQAFLVGLKGMAGRFYGYDPSRTSPRGIYSAVSDTPLVQGASQTGESLITDGWRISGTGLLLPGDYFEVTSGGVKELHMILSQVDSDASGVATLSFGPQLRQSPNDNAAIVLTSPQVEMRLIDDGQALWNVAAANIAQGFSFSGIEAF